MHQRLLWSIWNDRGSHSDVQGHSQARSLVIRHHLWVCFISFLLQTIFQHSLWAIDTDAYFLFIYCLTLGQKMCLRSCFDHYRAYRAYRCHWYRFSFKNRRIFYLRLHKGLILIRRPLFLNKKCPVDTFLLCAGMPSTCRLLFMSPKFVNVGVKIVPGLPHKSAEHQCGFSIGSVKGSFH